MIVRISVTGLEGPIGRLEEFASGAWKRGLLALAGGLVQRQTTSRIRSGGPSPHGAAWAGYAASALKRKKRGAGLLVDTGRLLGSISASVAGDTAIIGTNVFYGAYHQEGTPKMPARPFMGLSQANENELMDAVQAFLATRLAI